MVQLDRTVGVDVHQCPGLIEIDQSEGNSEFDRNQRNAPLQHRASLVPGPDLGPALCVIRGDFQFGDNVLNDVVFDGHVIMRRHAVFRPHSAVEVQLADIQRVFACRMGDRLDDPLHAHHALRPAKTSEGGVRDRMRLAAIRPDQRIRQIVAIVGVGGCAFRDGGRQVPRNGRSAAPARR